MHSQLLVDLLGHCVHINQSKVRGLRLDNISVSEKRRKERSDGPGRKERGEREKGGREEDKKQCPVNWGLGTYWVLELRNNLGSQGNRPLSKCTVVETGASEWKAGST